jgi:PHD/YefM family antitoxin component YafN of YafNO toxin-antitoxin module
LRKLLRFKEPSDLDLNLDSLGGSIGRLCYSRATEKVGGSKLKAMASGEVQYVSDENGQPVGVIVPIELWREIESERETAYLLKSAAMKQRLAAAKARHEGISLEDACEKLGI